MRTPDDYTAVLNAAANAIARINRTDLAIAVKAAEAFQRPGYFAELERITANANKLTADVGRMAAMVAALQQQSVATKLTPLVQKMLADNDAAMQRLASATAPLIDQIVNQRIDLPALSFEEVRARIVLAPIVASPKRARSKRARPIDLELAAARERIVELERRVRSLMFPDLFGDDEYPPMEPEYFGRN